MYFKLNLYFKMFYLTSLFFRKNYQKQIIKRKRFILETIFRRFDGRSHLFQENKSEIKKKNFKN